MTPERKEDIKRYAQSGQGYEDAFILNQEVLELLAALEEAEKDTRYWKQVKNDYHIAHGAVYAKLRETEGQLAEAQQTIARQREKIDAALSWTWNCGEANMLEVIAALNGKEQAVLVFPNCPICNSNNTLAHPNKAGTWLCVPCDKVFEDGEQP